jgi:hypothetical protein
MSLKERLMLKMMSNKVVMKIFSIPIVLKVTMWITQKVTSQTKQEEAES